MLKTTSVNRYLNFYGYKHQAQAQAQSKTQDKDSMLPAILFALLIPTVAYLMGAIR